MAAVEQQLAAPTRRWMVEVRVLWITCHLPWPPSSGGRLRENELLRRLASHSDCEVIAVSKTPAQDRLHLSEAASIGEVTVVAAEPDPGACCQQVGRHASPAAAPAIQEALDERPPDVVHVEGFYLMQHLPPDLDPPLLLVDQNIESDLWRQRSKVASSPMERAVAAREAAACQAAELEAWRRADLCGFVTDDDARAAVGLAPGLATIVVPDGADHLSGSPAVPLDQPPAGRRVCFVGNFGYQPNLDAAAFLLSEVLPRLRRAVPDAHLLLVGGSPPEWLRAAGERPGVTVTGWVDRVAPWLQASDVVVCPLRVGGGVKVKVLEPLSLGCAVVSTPIGAQGLPGRTAAPLVVPPTGHDLADGIARVLLDANLRAELQEAARHLARRLPTWDQSTAELLSAYHELHASASADQVPA